MNDKISDKDKQSWENFLSSDEKLHDKDFKKNQKKLLKTKHIDLHGFTLENANKKIADIIDDAYDNSVSKIIVVTGKGLHSNVEKDPYVSKDLSILKYSVPEFISNNASLMRMINEITDAKIEDGGTRAFYIYLKKNKLTK